MYLNSVAAIQRYLSGSRSTPAARAELRAAQDAKRHRAGRQPGIELCWRAPFSACFCSAQQQLYRDTLFNIPVIAMLAVILFHAVTLPVEFNAQPRAR